MPDNPTLALVLTRAAQSDLRSIWIYTNKTWGRAQADRYIAKLRGSFDLLCDMPEICPVRQDFQRETRIYRSGEHLIFYRIVDETKLRVIRVLSQRQNWQVIFLEKN